MLDYRAIIQEFHGLRYLPSIAAIQNTPGWTDSRGSLSRQFLHHEIDSCMSRSFFALRPVTIAIHPED